MPDASTLLRCCVKRRRGSRECGAIKIFDGIACTGLLVAQAVAVIYVRRQLQSSAPQGVHTGGQSEAASNGLPTVHFIYCTGCNAYQLIVSTIFDDSWRRAGNTGRLTRIVAGCASQADEEFLMRSPLAGLREFSVFIAKGTLDRIPGTGELYPARSRPYAIEQWMRASFPTEKVIAMLDPDFVHLKPLSAHIALYGVRDGKMASSTGWWGHPGLKTRNRSYFTGPVWFLTTNDLFRMLPDWQNLTDNWKKVADGLMREQHAFQRSAVIHQVPAIFHSSFSQVLRTNPDDVPYSVHYYRSYNYKTWGFHKALTSDGWYADKFTNSVPIPLRCGAPLLQEPPLDLPPLEGDFRFVGLTLRTILPAMNKAFRSYREIYCPGERDIFDRQGIAAFGLSRTMHPRHCQRAGHGGFTRYRVDVTAVAAWDQAQALGGDVCSEEAMRP
mmetsp:Transcript_34926/g.96477  ORF Transcript_34926/g.96477 Transcript_34926/m.96477 type:complete len:442 (+) Transcript_34926:62-1387(+)